jgi:hypothetical protein
MGRRNALYAFLDFLFGLWPFNRLLLFNGRYWVKRLGRRGVRKRNRLGRRRLLLQRRLFDGKRRKLYHLLLLHWRLIRLETDCHNGPDQRQIGDHGSDSGRVVGRWNQVLKKRLCSKRGIAFAALDFVYWRLICGRSDE